MKTVKIYKALFYGSKEGVIGPHPYTELIMEQTKRSAISTAKRVAKDNDWRFLQIL